MRDNTLLKESPRLSWLAALLDGQRDRTAKLFFRMRGLLAGGALAAMKPAKFRKFIAMMQEVDEARVEEVRILNRIDRIEAAHKRNRKNRQLKNAAPSTEEKQFQPQLFNPEAERPKDGWLWFVTFWYMFVRGGNGQAKQELNTD